MNTIAPQIKLWVPADDYGPDLVVTVVGDTIPEVYRDFHPATEDQIAAATVFFDSFITGGILVHTHHS